MPLQEKDYHEKHKKWGQRNRKTDKKSMRPQKMGTSLQGHSIKFTLTPFLLTGAVTEAYSTHYILSWLYDGVHILHNLT